MSAPFFIVGTQRSGTTLLSRMLGTHPDLYVLNEFWALYEYLLTGTPDLAALEELLTSHLRLPTGCVSPGAAPADAFGHVELAFAAKLRAVGKRRWAIKDPRLTYHMELFLDRYPQAKCIVIFRDARGVTNSYLSRKMNVANVFFGAGLWRDETRRQLELAARHPGNCLHVRFEELLAEPREVLQQICAFLGETFHEDLLAYHRVRPEMTIHEGNINATRPVQPVIAAKWRTELSPRQIGVIEAVAGDRLQELGYPLAAEPRRVGRVERFLYGVHQRVMTTWWWQKRSRGEGVRRRLRVLIGRS